MSRITTIFTQNFSVNGRLQQFYEAIANAERLTIMMWIAIGVGIVGRLVTFTGEPLWLDETFSAVIATQKTFASFYEWISFEVGGPIYYTMLWLWQFFAGNSNNALRLPSLLISLLSIVVAFRCTELSDRTRLTYVALTSLTPASFLQGSEARSYALVVLLCSIQLFVFIRLLRRPSMPLAMFWVSISTAAILTHYHAAFVSLVQGLIYIGYCKGKAARTWPAIVCLLPAVIWLKLQLDFISGYATPGLNWYKLLNISDLPSMVPLTLRFGWFAYVVSAIAIYLSYRWFMRRTTVTPVEKDYVPILAALSGVVAAIVIVVLGLIVPSFSPRYLSPSGPAVLLGASLTLVHSGQIWPRALVKALIVAVGVSLSFCAQIMSLTDDRNPLAFNRASNWIMAHSDPKRVVFYWDNPTGDFSSVKHLKEVGGFFFARAGRSPQIVIPRGHTADTDPNKQLLELAGSDRQGAIIWLAEKGIPSSRAVRHGEKLSSDPEWQCLETVNKQMFVLACLPAR